MLKLIAINRPCDSCGDDDGHHSDCRVLLAGEGGAGLPTGLVLCVACRIRAEALLRGARKSGPRVGNWPHEVPS